MPTKDWISKLLWLLLFLGSATSMTAKAADVTAVRVAHFDAYTRVIFIVNDPSRYHVFTLEHPHRVVVDFLDGHLKSNLKQLNFADTSISNARSGRPVENTLRIVFDTNEAVKVKSSFVGDKNPVEGELVVDIYPKVVTAKAVSFPDAVIQQIAQAISAVKSATTPEPAAAPVAVKAEVKPELRAESKPEPQATMQTVVITSTSVKAQPQPAALITATNVVKAEVPVIKTVTKTIIKVRKPRPQLVDVIKSHTIVVVIDPGHGGKDSGTIGKGGAQEKDIVLAIGQRLAVLINKEPNMRAVLTRNGDYFVTLRDRLMLSRQSKADLFIAIHADSYFNDQSIGASVYALSHHGATSMAARWLADRENHSELGGVDLNELGDKSYILRSVLIDLAQTATINDSMKLGTDVLDNLENVTTLHYPRVEQAPFMVLKSPDIPSVLVETGFLSNSKEEERLQSAAYRDKLAHALLGGIHHYMASHPLLATTRTQKTVT
jgi:N-acetylmuramoyl-L-alanine amidase